MSKQNKGSCQSHQGFNNEGAMETCRRTVAFRARCRFRQPQTFGRERQEYKFKITLAI